MSESAFEKELTLTVTEEHIEGGQRGDARCCPIALCAMETFEGAADFVTVTPTSVTLWKETSAGNEMISTFFHREHNWVFNFDAGDAMEPIDVDIAQLP